MEKDSPILITGAGGFVGKNLVATLRTAGYTDLMLFEKDDTPETLADYCRRAAFVVHLAGINRPTDPSEFYTGNAGLTDTLLVGAAQALATCPGLSRSGTTITAGCFLGFERKFAVRYSFILSIPAVLGANILSLKDAMGGEVIWKDVPVYLAGVLVAAAAGYACIRLLKMIVIRENSAPLLIIAGQWAC